MISLHQLREQSSQINYPTISLAKCRLRFPEFINSYPSRTRRYYCPLDKKKQRGRHYGWMIYIEDGENSLGFRVLNYKVAMKIINCALAYIRSGYTLNEISYQILSREYVKYLGNKDAFPSFYDVFR